MLYVDICSGGGLASLGLRQAGYECLASFEIDPRVAALYRDNVSENVRTGDFVRLLPALDVPTNAIDLFWASLPCQEYSSETQRPESARSIAMAVACAKAIARLQPKSVIIENVAAFRHSKSYLRIEAALQKGGYDIDCGLLNCANYGVPQTRKRFFAIAVREKRAKLPPPTHHQRDPNQLSLGLTKPWVSWLDAIADISEQLPETDLAPWQQKRITQPFEESTLIQKVGANNDRLMMRSARQPSWTVRKCNRDRHWEQYNAFITLGHRSRIVSLPPEVVARFQTVPDSYRFTGDRAFDIGVIGNGVPTLIAKTLAKQATSLLT